MPGSPEGTSRGIGIHTVHVCTEMLTSTIMYILHTVLLHCMCTYAYVYVRMYMLHAYIHTYIIICREGYYLEGIADGEAHEASTDGKVDALPIVSLYDSKEGSK